MRIEYRIDRELGVVRRGFTGEIALADFEQHWRRVLADPDLPYSLFMFADMRDCRITVHGNDANYFVRGVMKPLLGEHRCGRGGGRVLKYRREQAMLVDYSKESAKRGRQIESLIDIELQKMIEDRLHNNPEADVRGADFLG